MGGNVVITQASDEEVTQLRDMLSEKDKIIDMLTKEKTYYAKKCEQHSKNLQNEVEMVRARIEQET